MLRVGLYFCISRASAIFSSDYVFELDLRENFKYSGHSLVQLSNFKILMQIQSKDINTKKIAEPQRIQKYKPTLNTQ